MLKVPVKYYEQFDADIDLPYPEEGFGGWQDGFVNITDGNFSGFQSGFVNITKGNFKGFQLGLYSSSRETSGLQLGVVNISEKLDGLQVGLVNINKSGEPHGFLPIVNYAF